MMMMMMMQLLLLLLAGLPLQCCILNNPAYDCRPGA
jgi:hypothetical protein